jgi:hypothetical protein
MHAKTRRKYRGRDRTLIRDLVSDLKQAIANYNKNQPQALPTILPDLGSFVKASDLLAALQADLTATVTIAAI